jgi:hypothetical protein
VKDAQAKAILDVFDAQLQSGQLVAFGRQNAKWFARVGDTTCQGVTLQDALAQVAQVLTCESQEMHGVLLPRDWTETLRRVREGREVQS